MMFMGVRIDVRAPRFCRRNRTLLYIRWAVCTSGCMNDRPNTFDWKCSLVLSPVAANGEPLHKVTFSDGLPTIDSHRSSARSYEGSGISTWWARSESFGSCIACVYAARFTHLSTNRYVGSRKPPTESDQRDCRPSIQICRLQRERSALPVDRLPQYT